MEINDDDAIVCYIPLGRLREVLAPFPDDAYVSINHARNLVVFVSASTPDDDDIEYVLEGYIDFADGDFYPSRS